MYKGDLRRKPGRRTTLFPGLSWEERAVLLGGFSYTKPALMKTLGRFLETPLIRWISSDMHISMAVEVRYMRSPFLVIDQNNGYNGDRIPEDRYRGDFGPDHVFRIYSYPVVAVGAGVAHILNWQPSGGYRRPFEPFLIRSAHNKTSNSGGTNGLKKAGTTYVFQGWRFMRAQ